MGVIESATRLFDLLASRDDTFTKHLIPGLPKEEIARLVAPTGVQLPAEAVEFYSRFNLPKGYMYDQEQPWFYGIYWFLGLEDAVDEILDSRKKLWEEEEFFPAEEFPDKAGWFPLLQEDPNLYVLDTANTVDGRCPVLDFGEYDNPAPAFISLEAMFDTFYYWLNEGALEIENGGVVGHYKGDPRRVVEIANRINPGLAYWNAWLEYNINPPDYLRSAD